MPRRSPRAPAFAVAATAALGAAALACRSAIAAPLPWEIWKDLSLLAELPARARVLERSSFCPSGCRFDRHSAGDSRFLYASGEEGVIFDEAGAGAITRIWATMGPGVSEPLDPSIGVRIYLDGSDTPAIDVPLPALFDGSTPPFLPPLVADRALSSGGNVSYVPIAYRNGCRVALTGAGEERIWFQLHFHRLADGDDVVTFTGGEDLSAWSELLSAPGSDPWPRTEAGTGESSTLEATSVSLGPGESKIVASADGPDTITALRLRTSPLDWANVELRLELDGEVTASMALEDFFAVGRSQASPTRSLLAGVDESGFLYFYAPIPFFASARVELVNATSGPADPIPVDVEVRRRGEAPEVSSGIFGAERRVADPTAPGSDAVLLDLEGHGKWFGLFADLGSVATTSRQYLEGDERVYVDGSPHPAWYGTGVEDFFAGGFYFDAGPFGLALHGVPYHLTGAEAEGEDVTAAYRWMAGDALSFESSILAALETGPTANLAMRMRTVAYYYRRAEPRLERADLLDLASETSRTDHAYASDVAVSFPNLASTFQGEPPLALETAVATRSGGTESFQLRPRPGDNLFRLRRRLDAAAGPQLADVFAGGVLAGRFSVVAPNPTRRWTEDEIDLARAALPDADGNLEIAVFVPESQAGGAAPTFTAASYELLSGRRSCAALDRVRVRLSSRGRFGLSALAITAGARSSDDPRESFAATLSTDDAAAHLRVDDDPSGWAQSHPQRGRFAWRGDRRGLLRVRVSSRGDDRWSVRLRGRDVVGAQGLDGSTEPVIVEIEIGAACYRGASTGRRARLEAPRSDTAGNRWRRG